MKKVLSTVAALGLVAGFAATASAVDVKLSGYYEVDGIFYDHGDANGVAVLETDPEAHSNAWFMHTFHVKPVLKINDKTKVVADLWLADDSIWGGQNGATPTATPRGDLNTVDGEGFEVHKLFMEYMSPVGKWRVGRTLAGPWGLDFNNNEGHANRIMWWPSFLKGGGITTLLYYQKSRESDALTDNTDRDKDYYEARFYHKSAPGQAIMTLAYDRDGNAKQTAMKFKLCGDYLFNNIYTKAEFEFLSGEDDDNDYDIEGMAFFADVGVKMDKLDIGGMFFYGSGDDDGFGANNDKENFFGASNGTGEDFEPLYILTGYTTGMLNGGFAGADSDMTDAGVLGLVAHADFKVTDAMSLNAAVGYAMAESEPALYLDDEYGFEVNAGMSYKLLDNLTYDLHLGYLMTGDFFQGTNPLNEVEDIILATHHLTMEF